MIIIKQVWWVHFKIQLETSCLSLTILRHIAHRQKIQKLALRRKDSSWKAAYPRNLLLSFPGNWFYQKLQSGLSLYPIFATTGVPLFSWHGCQRITIRYLRTRVCHDAPFVLIQSSTTVLYVPKLSSTHLLCKEMSNPHVQTAVDHILSLPFISIHHINLFSVKIPTLSLTTFSLWFSISYSYLTTILPWCVLFSF